jgi:hypothetical protein
MAIPWEKPKWWQGMMLFELQQGKAGLPSHAQDKEELGEPKLETAVRGLEKLSKTEKALQMWWWRAWRKLQGQVPLLECFGAENSCKVLGLLGLASL